MSNKTPIIATFVILFIFTIQAVLVVNLLNQKRDLTIALSLAQKSQNIIQNKDILKYQSSLIYEYAILNLDGKIVFSNLKELPKTLNFITLKDSGYIYYKDFFNKNGEIFYIIVAKKLDKSAFYLRLFLMISLNFMIIFLVMYFSYLSIIKPCLRQKDMMSAFFNDAMHELKTPLGVASINLEMLDIKNKHTYRIKSALKQMKITYEDIEYFIKNEKIKFEKKELNLSENLKDRLRFIHPIANCKNIAVSAKIEPNLRVFMSSVELTRLIDNNLSNAIKYSKENSQIIVNLQKDDKFAIFSVEDFGIGIKDTSKIWKRYSRQDKASGGFGLGLNIVLKICKKYGISYSVISKYSKGSKFIYKLPLLK
ncbi:MAG: HAMP domain-containing histidine kinase [Campylobacter sp.]|nr:HAMP domain-containing histidine kinase [Campylobacter sp.]